MQASEAAATWLGWFARERRASAHSVEAYGRDVAQFLAFLTGHLGAEPDLAALGALRPADLRAFLSARAMGGDSAATRARKLAAIRGFLRYLQRHQGMAPVALAGHGLILRWRKSGCVIFAGSPGCRNMQAHMRSAIPSRRICWAAALICARFRNCSAMPAFRPRSAIRRWMRQRCWRLGERRILGLTDTGQRPSLGQTMFEIAGETP